MTVLHIHLSFELSTGLQFLFIDKLEHPAMPSTANIKINFIPSPWLFDFFHREPAYGVGS